MARGLASFFQMIARVETSQPPNSPLWVQSWILFKDDDKVPLGLSKVLGWREGCASSLAGNSLAVPPGTTGCKSKKMRLAILH